MRTCLSAFALLLSVIAAAAQTAPKKLNWDSVEVKDANGTVYPAIIAQKLMATGKYSLRMSPDGKKALLHELTGEEINRRLSSLPKPMESKFFSTGQSISSFKEKDMNGVKYNLKELRGKVVVLNFWFINCPPCRQEIPHLNEMVDAYRDNKDVVFLAVALDERSELEQFLKTMPYHYNIIDGGRYIAQQYGITSYPTHVILDKQGKVIFHTSGFGLNTVSWLKKSIEAGLTETEAK